MRCKHDGGMYGYKECQGRAHGFSRFSIAFSSLNFVYGTIIVENDVAVSSLSPAASYTVALINSLEMPEAGFDLLFVRIVPP